MASHQLLNYPNQVRDSYNSAKIFHGCSKAQASLSKILHTISSSAPHETGTDSSSKPRLGGLRCGNRGFGIDLNLRLGPPPEIEDCETPVVEGRLSECSVVGEVIEIDSPELCDGFSTIEKSSEGECDTNKEGASSSCKRDSSTTEENHEEEEEEEEEEVVGEKATEISEITNLQFQSFETDNNGVSEQTKDKNESNKAEEEYCNELENKDEGFLGLLIEAARLISGEFEGDDESEPAKLPSEKEEVGEQKVNESEMKVRVGRRRSRSKREECEWERGWYGDFEDVSPVVRTKRGRSQVLPYRYRDSVIEPWKRLQKKRSSPMRKKLSR